MSPILDSRSNKAIITTQHMAEVIQESVATSVKTKTTGMETVEYVIYFILGVLEVLLSFRLVLKLAGASWQAGL